MTKQLYFSDSFNQNLYPLPREIRPQSILKPLLIFISVIKKLITIDPLSAKATIISTVALRVFIKSYC